MSAYRELIKRGDADHTQLTELEFILYTGAKLRGGDPVLSEAAAELSAMRWRIAELEGERDRMLNALELIDHMNAGYVSEIAREARRAALERTERS